MNNYLYSIIEFLGQPTVIILFLAIIFFCFMFRITGSEKLWNEKKLEAQKDNLENEKIILERKKIAKELEEEQTKDEIKQEPNIIYIKDNYESNIIITLLIIFLIISLYFNYEQYQELQQYKQIMGEIKNGISIFQEFYK